MALLDAGVIFRVICHSTNDGLRMNPFRRLAKTTPLKFVSRDLEKKLIAKNKLCRC